MITKERLKFINDNLRHGDKKAIEKKTKVSHDTVCNILYGKCYGYFGDVVTKCAENIIKARNKKLLKEKKTYSSAQ